ncbi:hypothetical protein DJ533_17300 [Acinetobacter defluvii]|uniref:Uncharacterized protein n=1 Tax=Acinetobacter defluvii TaxID=1871111 RepID=A0A2S2FGU7_9GAMM|nr:hypothetical protein [Acinetobacter defluvii]AWL30193.1 hypothetical protein DJ533_17300 [Acinetobacter defluvii]
MNSAANTDCTNGKSYQLSAQYITTTTKVDNPDKSRKDITIVASNGKLFDCENTTIQFSVDNNDNTSLQKNTKSPNAVYAVILPKPFVL